MMRLAVDGRPCDLFSDFGVSFGFDAENLFSAESARQGITVEVELPSTRANNEVFGSLRDPYAKTRFNTEHHTAEISADGMVLLSGTAYLLSVSMSERSSVYSLRIIGGSSSWAESAVRRMIGDADIAFSTTFTPMSIAATWTGDSPVRFLPVCRSGRTAKVNGSSLLPAERIMLTDDYHPFISLQALVRDIFSEAGYTLQSAFIDGEYFASLYMSGAYSDADTSAQRSAMDFLARRRSLASAQADSLGRVVATPSVAEFSLGNIVDTADPSAVDDLGQYMSDTFSRNGCFFVDDDGYACFKPVSAVEVGFLLHLEYDTSFRIVSRTRLAGFDRVRFLPGVDAQFAIANTFTDYRDNPTGGLAYRVIVFDYVAGRKYRLCIRSGSSLTTVGEFSERSAIISLPSTLGGTVELMSMNDESKDFVTYAGDWAMYAGHVEETGTVSLELDMRIPPQTVSAGSKFLLDKFIFEGADPGMTITVGRATSLRPYFSTNPGYGSAIGFADISRHGVRLMEVLDAVQHMFNLAIYTDERSKTVYIEPEEEFYDSSTEFDWTGRIDFSQPVVISDAGLDKPQWKVYGYVEADAAAAEISADRDRNFGSWTAGNPLYGAKQYSQHLTNPLFTATVNKTGLCATAPSASIMCVGDTGAGDEGLDTVFTPHVVRYAGMCALPQNQTWGYPSNSGEYPLAAFHYAGDDAADGGFTLSFDDEDSQTGLHCRYDASVARTADRQYLELSLRLTPVDIVHLFRPDGLLPSLRSTFRFRISGESSRYRLCGLDGYNPSTGSTRCRFIRLTED